MTFSAASEVRVRPVAVRRWQAITLLLAFACHPAAAQTPPSAARQPAGIGSGPYRIAGTVISGTTGDPLRHATIALLSEADSHTVASVESDNEGRFALTGLPAAKYQLTASKRGFRTAFYDEHEEYNSAIVTGPGQDTGQLIFRLDPGSVLHGAITADGGDPVEGAKVMLFRAPPDHGQEPVPEKGPSERITQEDSGTTDDTGTYEFSNLAPGKYFLAVIAQPWYALHRSAASPGQKQADDPSAALDVAYPVTFFDSTTEEASATPIVLGAGRREEANVVLHAVPALHILVQSPHEFGSVNGLSPLPALRRQVFGTQISADATLNEGRSLPGVIDFNGVAPGHYELQQGNPTRIVALDASNSQQVEPSDGIPTFTVSGTLASAPGTSLPEDVSVSLDSLDGAHGPQTANAQKGRFRFDAVPPGRWQIIAWGPSGQLPVVSFAADGETHAGAALTVGDRALNIIATIAQGEVRIEGVAARDGKGVAGTMVVLVPKNTAAYHALVRRDQSDSDGSFSLRDVVPGRYAVVAIEDGWGLNWSRPEVLKRFLPRGVAITVTETSGKTIQLPEPVPVQNREPASKSSSNRGGEDSL
jgi:protocatechuate 3,4-dioxygenase beta subunit